MKGQKMKIRKTMTALAFAVVVSTGLFLASCGDADGDGLAPMDEKGKVLSDVTRSVAEDLADDERRMKEDETQNHITKPAPDYANTNY